MHQQNELAKAKTAHRRSSGKVQDISAFTGTRRRRPPGMATGAGRTRAVLNEIDRGMRFIAYRPVIPGIEPTSRTGRLICSATQALYLSAIFRGLPRERQLHPLMQQRIFDSMELFDDGVLGLGDHLDKSGWLDRCNIPPCSGAHRVGVPKIIDTFSRYASTLGVALPFRLRFRSIGTDIIQQMGRTSPATVLSQYCARIEQIRPLATRIGSIERLTPDAVETHRLTGEYVRQQTQLSSVGQYWQEKRRPSRRSSQLILVPPRPAPQDEVPPGQTDSIGLRQREPIEPSQTVADKTPAMKIISVGAWSLGIGAVTGVTTTAVGGVGGPMTITPGVSLIVTGLIVLTAG